MMDTMQQQDIRQRTILSIQSRFQLDTTHADNVAQTALSLLAQCGDGWVKEPVAPTLLAAAAAFHEIGITLGFKRDGEHAAYLLNHLDLPGFTLAQKQLLAEMVRHYREQLVPISGQNALSSTSANRLLRLLRLSVILCHRREKEAIPTFQLDAKDDVLTLNLEKGWLEGNALMTNELTLEEQRQSDNYWPLTIQA